MDRIPSQKLDKILTIVRDHLGLSDNAATTRQPNIESNINYMPDLIVRDSDRLIVIELKDTARFEAISTLYMYRKVLKDIYSIDNVTVVLMARKIRPQIEAIAKDYNILIIRLPPDIKLSDPGALHIESGVQKSKVTSEKSWKVISALLKNKFSTIRQISQKEGVSYGLAHLVVKTLEEQGVVGRRSGYFAITDIKKLLNGVAWERPFEPLRSGEFKTRFASSHSAARDISRWLDTNGKKYAFTGYTAGSLYTGYGIRHDAVYLYLDKDDAETLKDNFANDGSGRGKTITVNVYSPDRDVFSDSRELESVRVVSPAQALLDLAGLGYSGMDMTSALVEKYGNL